MLEQIQMMYQMTGKPALQQLSDDEWHALSVFVLQEIDSESERRIRAREAAKQASIARATKPEV